MQRVLTRLALLGIFAVLGVAADAQQQSGTAAPPPIPENPDSLFGPSTSGANKTTGPSQSAAAEGSSQITSAGSSQATTVAPPSSAATASGNGGGTGIESPDSMFQGDMVENVPAQSAEKNLKPAENLLVNQGIQLGGRLDSSFTAFGVWGNHYPELSNLSNGFTDLLVPTLQATLYFDARPDQHFRVFGKAISSYPFQTGTQQIATSPLGLPTSAQVTPNIDIFELFSDFDYKNKVYFRVGKQVVNWGVGYFFSPADVISITPIDPQNPTIEREGPVAVQTNVPFAGVDNFYLYLIANQAFATNGSFHVDDVAVAPKAEFVVGNYELGFGGYYQRSQRPKLMATASGSIGKVGVFGEAVLSQGTDKTLVREAAPASGIYESYADTSTPFFSGTVGFNYRQTDWNVSIYAQYFYNGPGYANATLEKAAYTLYEAQFFSIPHPGPLLTSQDILQPGRNYGAAVASWSDIRDSNVSLSLFWEGNFTDGSGLVSPSVSYQPFDHASFTAATHVTYGATGTEFVQTGRMSVSLEVSLGAGSF